jgi:hypothetical protein
MEVWKSIKELFVGTTYGFGIRRLSMGTQPFRRRSAFMPTTEINRQVTRKLYDNTGDNQLGGIFVKPCIDFLSNYIGVPLLSSGDENIDQHLNDCVQKYWKSELWEIWRDCFRDGDVWVRLRTPLPGPLTNEADLLSATLEIVDPERVEAFYDPFTGVLSRVEVVTKQTVETEEAQADLVGLILTNRSAPRTEEHEILEIITPAEYRYVDLTTNQELEQLRTTNSWGFVPFVRVFNDYDNTLGSGRSEIETAMPFISAFNEVLIQTFEAHKYHSIPKATFNLEDVEQFLRNNFPDSFKANGEFSGTVNWSGREIFFLDVDEKAGFVEAQSVLGDSKTLLEFCIDCICVAFQMPEWGLMRLEGNIAQGNITPQTLPFVKRVDRKRDMFEKYLDRIVRMSLVIYRVQPQAVGISWPKIRIEDILTEAQAFSAMVTGLDVANRAEAISKNTYRTSLRRFLPWMRTNQEEASDARRDHIDEARLAAEVEQIVNPQGNGQPNPDAIRGRLPLTTQQFND